LIQKKSNIENAYQEIIKEDNLFFAKARIFGGPFTNILLEMSLIFKW